MSLFPLGLIGQGGGAGNGGNALELIATSYGNGSSSAITFSSIPQTYKHLQIRSVSRLTANQNVININFNGITTSSYASHMLRGDGSSVTSAGLSAFPYTTIPSYVTTAPSTATASVGWPSIMDIIDYTNANKNKTIRTFNGAPGNTFMVVLQSGVFINTSAISSITLTAASGAFDSMSRFSLYGVL